MMNDEARGLFFLSPLQAKSVNLPTVPYPGTQHSFMTQHHTVSNLNYPRQFPEPMR